MNIVEKIQAVTGDFISDRLAAIIMNGGKPVQMEHKAARLEICRNCPLVGTVNPLPLVSGEGCRKCKCLLNLKTAVLYRKQYRIPEGLYNYICRILNALRLDLLRNFIAKNGKTVVYEKCPHPNGDRWAETDKKYIK